MDDAGGVEGGERGDNVMYTVDGCIPGFLNYPYLAGFM